MKLLNFCIEEEKQPKKTLADLPEWTVAECFYPHSTDNTTILRFRVRDKAYTADSYGIPNRQCLASEYVVKEVIGRIVCK